jgi:hypothetical protein
MSESDIPLSQEKRIWIFARHPGVPKAMETGGTVAAPLLAGFAFTLLVLVLPTLKGNQTAVRIGGRAILSTESHAFSRYPELAVALLLLAGLLMITCVQTAVNGLYHARSPSELEDLYPRHFRHDSGFDPTGEPANSGWNATALPSLQVGSKWYSGWVREYFHDEWAKAEKLYSRTRLLYNLGVLSLLSGIAVLVVPPVSDASTARWAILCIAVSGVLAEVVWISIDPLRGPLGWVRGLFSREASRTPS